MEGLDEGGLREIGLLRKRIRRLYGLDRLTLKSHDRLQGELNTLEESFKECAKEDGLNGDGNARIEARTA